MKIMKPIIAVMLIAVMATMLPFETEVSLAKRKKPPSKVYGLRLVKAAKRSITIKWRKARRARKYIVYRSRGRKGRFVKRFVTRRTRFTDYRVKPGTVYRYFIRGYNGRVGRRSSILKVRAKTPRYVVKKWKIGGDGNNLYDYNKQAWPTVKAVLYSDGLFELVGKGNIADFPELPPWYREKNSKTGRRYNKQIRYVYIAKSVKPTIMSSMFKGCTNLRGINRIPYTVENLSYAFEGCSNIIRVPAVPNRVESMYGTFSGCKSLRKAPELPKKVKILVGTFEGCRSLRKASTINKGNVIANARGMYKGCVNLRGDMWILGAIKKSADMKEFFSGAATVKGAGVKLRCRIGENEDITGVGTTIDKMIDSKSKDSKITEKPYFVKQSPVIRSWKIGGNGVTKYNHATGGASNVVATLHQDGLFKIVGKGNTAVLCEKFADETPWEKIPVYEEPGSQHIKYVYIGRDVGATNIDGWFKYCGNLKKLNRLSKSAKRMSFIFWSCKELQESPAIPARMLNMSTAFRSSGLKTAPILPEGVKNLYQAFAGCDGLLQAPEIPLSAEDVEEMFFACGLLRKPADIKNGNKIKKAGKMYEDCSNLSGEMYIYGAIAQESDVEYFFKRAASEPEASLKLMYSSSASDAVKATVDRLIAEKSPESNIVKEEY